MSAFRFGLQRLLSYRHTQEEEAKRELGLRTVVFERETARLHGLKQEEAAIMEQWRQEIEHEDLKLPRLQVTHDYSHLLENRLERQAEQYRRSKGQVEEQREIARRCWQKKKMLETLKSKARAEYLHQEAIRERNLIDDLVINTYFRKGGEK